MAIVGATTGETAAAVFTVSTTADDGAGSLRQAILDANSAAGADSVVFAATATGTILLLSALPEVTDDLDILGPGAGVLTVDGAGSFRVLAFGGTSTATISGLTIANGAVIDDVGGGIFNSGSAILTISDTVLSGNTATRGSSFFGFAAGGAIANFGRLTILRTTLAVNRATGSSAGNDAGGIQNGGTLTIVDSTISGNWTDGRGGGIRSFGTLIVTNSTISGNSAAAGGGGIFNEGAATISHSTVAGNSAGGILNSNVGNVVTLKSSLVANSTSGGDCSGGTFIDLGENLDTDDGCPLATVSPTALALGTLAANGGPTQTHALLTGSVAIDAGDCVDAFANPVVADQRGVPRPFDGDGTGGPQCDVGAYELGASVDVVDHSLAEGTGGTTIFSFTLTRTGDTLGPASVEATTSDGTAQAPGDYTPLSALLVSFAPGASTATVDVIVAADGAVEADETFTLTLGNPSPGLLIGVGSATGTILDDDVGVAIPTLDEWGQLLLAALVAAIGFAALRGGRAAG